MPGMLPADELLELMNTISEDDFAAGWRIDLEYILWRRVLSGRPDRRTQTLESLSGTAHGWWAWLPDGEGREEGRKFVPLDEWCALFAADPVRGAEVDRDTLDFAPPLAAPAGAPAVIDGSREHWELRACAHSVERSHPLLARDLRERYRLGVETPEADKLDAYTARIREHFASPRPGVAGSAVFDGGAAAQGEPWISAKIAGEVVDLEEIHGDMDTQEQARAEDLIAEGLVRSYVDEIVRASQLDENGRSSRAAVEALVRAEALRATMTPAQLDDAARMLDALPLRTGRPQ